MHEKGQEMPHEPAGNGQASFEKKLQALCREYGIPSAELLALLAMMEQEA